MAQSMLIPFLGLFGLLSSLLVSGIPVERHLQTRQKVEDFQLRILPLGASITWGYHSTTGNGYRKPLRDQLRFAGWDVNMVGTKNNGNMADDDVEAHSGDIIAEVEVAAQGSLIYKPNVVLINAGTNDCNRDGGIDIPGVGGRMRKMINTLITAPDMEKTLIVLSTLLPSDNANIKKNRISVNEQYRDLVKSMRAEGVSIVLADMDPPAPDSASGWISYPADYTGPDGVPDDTHPNDGGYEKMASIWYDAIEDAAAQDLIVAPADVNLDDGDVCEKQYGDGISAGGLTQHGSGVDDGIYYHASEAEGIVFSMWGGEDQEMDDPDTPFFFARLFSQDRDDLLTFHKDEDTGDVEYDWFYNTGKTGTGDVLFQDTTSRLTVHDNCNAGGVHFIDINGDGLDDFVCIALDGTAYASVNQGDGDAESEKPPNFKSIGKWKDSEGADQANVRLADIDGDGRADYCTLAGNGDVTCWRNGWIEDVPQYWQPLGKRFTGKGMGDLRGVRFEDINGDGRDDWLWVDDDGQTTTYTNSRSCITGEEGDGLNVVWRQGFQKGHTSGPTHAGMGAFDMASRDRVHFARVYGEPQDFGLLGRQDYVFINKRMPDDSLFGPLYEMHVWKNVGSGATKIKSDGDRYCNMMGHENGMEDYVWILSQGKMRLYPNKGLVTVPDDVSYWGPNRIIWDPTAEEIGKPLDRRDLHLVDWDGDGACDIVWTDPENQNRVKLWRNHILDNDNGDFNWEYVSNPAPDLSCGQKRGLGFFDRPVHMADISGNAKGDYLCVEKDGRTTGFVHTDDGWDNVGQVKFAEGKDRANLHWADVNGDGRADMIHTNKFNGDGTVWYNRGRKDISGSSFEWERVGVKYEGAVAGSCTYFPDLNGDGRADMHSIIHSIDNTAKTWYNGCAAKDHTGDDGPITDPGLPQVPSTNPFPVTAYVAFGDSYAAGVAAGEPLDDTDCWRYSDGYPPQLNRSEFLSPDHSFQHLACSGARVGGGGDKDVNKQIDQMGPADVVTISIAGNDAGFFKILDGCVFKFLGFWPIAYDCQTELKNAQDTIASDKFADDYNTVLDRIVAKNPKLVFANGYSPFFDDAMTDECDDKSLGYWGAFQPELTSEVREQINGVCNQLNDRLGQIIKDRGDSRVKFVNWAHRFSAHRWCQPGRGVDAGEDTWFFDIGNRGESSTMAIGDIDPETCQAEADASGDWGALALCGIARTHANDTSLKPMGGGEISTAGGTGDLMQPVVARVFHPKPQGYAAIRDEIISIWPS